jgi:hypothetical protein
MNYATKTFGPGPWDDEPDEYRAAAHGFPVILVRTASGTWCGYVGVPEGHPWFGKSPGEYRALGARVHGGVTWAQGDCPPRQEGEDPGRWWVGFDTGHSQDRSPVLSLYLKEVGLTEKAFDYPGLEPEYRTFEYSKAELEELAAQAQAAQH